MQFRVGIARFADDPSIPAELRPLPGLGRGGAANRQQDLDGSPSARASGPPG